MFPGGGMFHTSLLYLCRTTFVYFQSFASSSFCSVCDTSYSLCALRVQFLRCVLIELKCCHFSSPTRRVRSSSMWFLYLCCLHTIYCSRVFQIPPECIASSKIPKNFPNLVCRFLSKKQIAWQRIRQPLQTCSVR